jgi:hypothetical protein
MTYLQGQHIEPSSSRFPGAENKKKRVLKVNPEAFSGHLLPMQPRLA